MEKVRALLNMLTESTFLYPADDQDLYHFLRSNQSEFEQFFESNFGWQLHLDSQCARLIKRKHYNENVPPTARALFSLRKRDECLLFALLLEFFEEEGQKQGVLTDDVRHLRFLLSDFVQFAILRTRELQGERAAADTKLFESIKPLFEQLERHRFVKEIERKNADVADNLPSGMQQHMLFEFLPGIRCYDGSIASRQIVLDACNTTDRSSAEPDSTMEGG
jgi:hypothetical protein